jgi:hypothetical protein
MSVFVGGIVSIIIFYVLILAVGIWAGRKQKSTESNPDTEEIMLAGRNIGLIVGIFTMTGKYQKNICLNIRLGLLATFSSENFSYMGRWRVYQRHCRDYLLYGSGMVPGPDRLRAKLGFWRVLVCAAHASRRLRDHD